MSAFAAFGGAALTMGNTILNAYESNRQRSFIHHMWDLTNRYNSPVEQRDRLRKANVNPALAMQNGMMSSGESSQSPEPTLPQYDFSPAVQSINTAAQLNLQKKQIDADVRLTDENTIAQQQRNKFGLQDAYMDVCNKIADLKKKGADTDFLEKQAAYMQKQILAYDKRNNAEVNRIEREATLAEEQANLVRAQKSQQDIINQYLPKEKQKGLAIQDATVRELLSAANRNDADAAYAAANKMVAESLKEGQDIDNKTKSAMADALVDDAFNKADESYWSSENQRMEAGKSSGGAGPIHYEQRHSSDAANDPYHRRVRHDRNGRKYLYDSRTNKRVYIR